MGCRSEDGLAHVIDDGEEFPRAFGREVFLGILEKEKTERPFRDIRYASKNIRILKNISSPKRSLKTLDKLRWRCTWRPCAALVG